jgi:hypothetical protein
MARLKKSRRQDSRIQMARFTKYKWQEPRNSDGNSRNTDGKVRKSRWQGSRNPDGKVRKFR